MQPVDDKNKCLIILGSAPCLMDDLDAMPWICLYDYMAIGLDAVDRYPAGLKYVATFHPAEITDIRKRREVYGGNTDYKVISHEPQNTDIVIEDWWKPSGSSALLGVQAAIRLGYDRIILCGCPLQGKDRHGGDYHTMFSKGWNDRIKEIKDHVRSMSGWTRELLGVPTEEWIILT